MPAPITVVIPTLNAADTVGPTLACLYQAMGKSLINEVIFADGGSIDHTAQIADEAGVEVVKAPKGRGSQLSTGAKAAKGQWLLFVHADTVFSAGWETHMRAHINTQTKAGYCKLSFDTNGFAPVIIAGMANIRSRLFGLPYGDQALLISQKLYQQVGGYPDIPLMEDVALARKLRGKMMPMPITASTGAQRYIKDGWFARSRKNLITLALYFIGVTPEKLAKRYNR